MALKSGSAQSFRSRVKKGATASQLATEFGIGWGEAERRRKEIVKEEREKILYPHRSRKRTRFFGQGGK